MVGIVRSFLPEQMCIHKLYILNVPLGAVSKLGPDHRILEHVTNLASGPSLFRCWLVLLLNWPFDYTVNDEGILGAGFRIIIPNSFDDYILYVSSSCLRCLSILSALWTNTRRGTSRSALWSRFACLLALVLLLFLLDLRFLLLTHCLSDAIFLSLLLLVALDQIEFRVMVSIEIFDEILALDEQLILDGDEFTLGNDEVSVMNWRSSVAKACKFQLLHC